MQGKSSYTTTETQQMSLELTQKTNTSGLIGVQTDAWTAANGTVFFIARMNRRECANRYHAMMSENERNIGTLVERAQTQRGTFDAIAALSFAHRIAEANDNFAHLAHVLQPARDKPFGYGNADAIKALLAENAALITLRVTVEGDVNGRFAKAFMSYFTDRGFKTTNNLNAPFILSARITTESADFGAGQQRKYINWTLDAGILTNDRTSVTAKEVFTYSGNGRNGANTEQQARQVMYRAIERSITDSDEEDGFAQGFEAFLSSLL
jgi:hypothetical protein